MTSEREIESEILAKGLNAPRLTPEKIDAVVAQQYWGRAADLFKGTPAESDPSMQSLTLCVLVLKNGFTVVGKSTCASPENYDAEIGAKIAAENARRQVWALEGYALREKLSA